MARLGIDQLIWEYGDWVHLGLSNGPPRLMVHAHDQQFVGMPLVLVIDSEWWDAPTPHDSTRAKSRGRPFKLAVC